MVTHVLPTSRVREQPIDLGPRSTYEVVTREKMEHIAADVAEIRNRINTIFYLIIGSVLVNIILSFMP